MIADGRKQKRDRTNYRKSFEPKGALAFKLKDRGITSNPGKDREPDAYLVERARAVAAEVQVAIENGQFDAARAAIDAAERIGGRPTSDITTLAESSPVVELFACGGYSVEISVKLCNELERHGITNIGQLLNTTRERLFAMNNIGPESVARIIHIAERWVAGQRKKLVRMNGASEPEAVATPG